MIYGIIGVKYGRIMFLECKHLIDGTVELLESHILLKFELEWIDYILMDYKVIS